MTNRKTGNQKRKYSFNRYEDIDKCIWKVFDTFGHDEKIENLVYWTKKLQKERATFRKKAVKYDELQSILEEYNVTPEILREVLLTGQMFRNQPTFDECIKEWEDRGWTYHKSEYYNWFFVKKEYKEICFDYDKINYECESFFEIDLELNILITKTLKALEEMKDE